MPKQQNKDKILIFRKIAGSWKDVAGDSGTLADWLQTLGLLIDNKCVFARFRDYENEQTIIYRDTGGSVQLQIRKWD